MKAWCRQIISVSLLMFQYIIVHLMKEIILLGFVKVFKAFFVPHH